jgi:hypothetical protein
LSAPEHFSNRGLLEETDLQFYSFTVLQGYMGGGVHSRSARRLQVTEDNLDMAAIRQM